MNRMQVVPQAALDVTRDFFVKSKTHLQCPHGDLLVINEQGMLWSHHSSGWFLHMRGEGIPRGIGLSWLTLEEKRVQVFHNPGTHPKVVGAESHLAPKGVQLSGPMYDSSSQPLAVIHLLRSTSQPFDVEEIAWLEMQCAQISPTLEAALRMDAELLQAIMRQSSKRTQQLLQLTLDFAIYLGESPVYARAVALGAMLLSDETALRTSKNAPTPLETRHVLQYQQAQFDGTGSPGLPGAQIPMAARIAKVTTTFAQHLEAGLDTDHALAKLRREAGWQLDPLLVRALEQHVQAQANQASKKLELFGSSFTI
jgi:hypothetical protein